MNEANYFIFRCSCSKKIPAVYILKVPQGDDEWYSIQRKDIRGENPKKYLRQ